LLAIHLKQSQLRGWQIGGYDWRLASANRLRVATHTVAIIEKTL
jgi:hypothetical protein